MHKRHYIKVITFFSTIILIAIFIDFLFSVKQQSKQAQILLSPKAPIPSEVLNNQAIIQQASISGTIICTDEDPSICDKNQEGKVLEYNVGCNGSIPSGSQYICKQGRWQYVTWTDHGFCRSSCVKK